MSDEVFSCSSRIERPAAEVFAWHERPGALARLCPPWERVEILDTTGGVRDGARVRVRTKVGPAWSEWEVEHRDYVSGVQFRDVQVRGPFARWEHTHRFEAEGAEACRLTDEIVYRLPGGSVGRALGAASVKRRLERLFRWRHATTKADLEQRCGERRTVLIAGASGLIGRTLGPFLQTQGHVVRRLVRRAPREENEVFWNPAAGEIDGRALEGVDAVVNLSGENVGAGRWTAARREEIVKSRIDATTTLVRAMAEREKRPEVLVSTSAMGFYGAGGDEVVTEAAGMGVGFLPEVCRRWEDAAREGERLGVRVVRLRFGVVLTPAGGALGKMLPVFRTGLGGRIGAGAQWMSWIGIDDAVAAVQHAMVKRSCDGAVNGVAPGAVRNREFAETLGRVLRRPAVVPVPAAGLKMVFGQMAEEALLTGVRAVPTKLEATGFRFRQRELEGALRRVLGRDLKPET